MTRVRVLEMIDKPFLGGGQVTVLTLARGLDREKFEVLVASEDGGPLVDELRKIGIRHVPIKLGKFSGLVGAARARGGSPGQRRRRPPYPRRHRRALRAPGGPESRDARPSFTRSTASTTSTTGIPRRKGPSSSSSVGFPGPRMRWSSSRWRTWSERRACGSPGRRRRGSSGTAFPRSSPNDFAIPRRSGRSSAPSGGLSSSRCRGFTDRRA